MEDWEGRAEGDGGEREPCANDSDARMMTKTPWDHKSLAGVWEVREHRHATQARVTSVAKQQERKQQTGEVTSVQRGYRKNNTLGANVAIL